MIIFCWVFSMSGLLSFWWYIIKIYLKFGFWYTWSAFFLESWFFKQFLRIFGYEVCIADFGSGAPGSNLGGSLIFFNLFCTFGCWELNEYKKHSSKLSFVKGLSTKKGKKRIFQKKRCNCSDKYEKKLKPRIGFEPRTSGFQSERATTTLSVQEWINGTLLLIKLF